MAAVERDPRLGAWGTSDPAQVFAYRRVNGGCSRLPPGISIDNPLGQMGRSALLEKGGARLRTIEGQMALLRVEPLSGTYLGINPFVDPTPFQLDTPEGVTVVSEGPLGLARVTVQPKANRLRIDYALPPPEGNRGIERLQQEQPRWFRAGADMRVARARSARALRVGGMVPVPRVELNGKELPGPFAHFRADGRTWFRIPITE